MNAFDVLNSIGANVGAVPKKVIDEINHRISENIDENEYFLIASFDELREWLYQSGGFDDTPTRRGKGYVYGEGLYVQYGALDIVINDYNDY